MTTGGDARPRGPNRSVVWRTPICFLDETGSLRAARDPYFAVGMVKSSRPEILNRSIKAIRDKAHFYDELKWANLSGSIKYGTEYDSIVDAFFASPNTSFSCLILDKSRVDPIDRYGDIWSAYESLAGLQVAYSTHEDELPTVLADDMSTPTAVRFEEKLRKAIQVQGKAVGAVCRVDSKGVHLVQVADLLMGAVAYSYKIKAGVVPAPSTRKLALADRVARHVGVASLAGPIKTAKFRVVELR